VQAWKASDRAYISPPGVLDQPRRGRALFVPPPVPPAPPAPPDTTPRARPPRHLKRRGRTRCAMRSARARSARPRNLSPTNSCGRCSPIIPRPACGPTVTNVPTSTGDDVIQKHTCAVDRRHYAARRAGDRTMHDRRRRELPEQRRSRRQSVAPAGAPTSSWPGGTQLHGIFDDDGIYAWRFTVDGRSANTRLTGPEKIAVAPYHYLCDGQLTTCVRQRGPTSISTRRRQAHGGGWCTNINGRESVVAVHSVNTAAFGVECGGTSSRSRRAAVCACGSRAPTHRTATTAGWRVRPSTARQYRDRYSFGGTPIFAGQRFAARLAGDPLGVLTLHEAVLAEGQAPQINSMRWEDYPQTAVDPTDDCTICTWAIISRRMRRAIQRGSEPSDYVAERDSMTSPLLGEFLAR